MTEGIGRYNLGLGTNSNYIKTPGMPCYCVIHNYYKGFMKVRAYYLTAFSSI